MTAYLERLSPEDKQLIDEIASGKQVKVEQDSSPKYRELATGLLLQLADSELAGAAGYGQLVNLAPSLSARIELSQVVHDKFAMAESAYKVIEGLGVNVEKYFLLHSWESRIQRHAQLGYRRASSDKRLNALMFPLSNWADLSVFTYLMATMAHLQFEEFSAASFSPLAQLAANSMPIEKLHAEFGLKWLSNLIEVERQEAQLSIYYWHDL
ncbi:MAG: phenylacetate-CoA oxygenase subunit PaaI, partial [Candidatus Obscuribacterales bacterium]|nr:phenylacetate-CoA oxygenase subunit PaaI [Candidatus Obscuribacterales bacterium]